MNRTIMQEPYEIEVFTNIVSSVKNIEGDLAEVGVWKGGTAKIMRENSDKPMYLFDTFEGLPDCMIEEDLNHKQFPGICKAEESFVKELNLPNTTIVKGIFPETSSIIKDKHFSFVHLDTDIYKSTLDGLEFFFPRMTKGGKIIIHDYPYHPGVRKAADEYLKDKNADLVRSGERQLIITI